MHRFKFENQGAISYLVYEVQAEDKIDTISLNMLSGNQIKGLADTTFLQMDDKRFIRYNVTAKITANQFFTRPIGKKSFLGILFGIADALISAEAYMIDPQSIVLDLDSIFTDVSTGETILICLPIEGCRAGADPRKFLKEVLISAQFDPTEDGAYVTKILTYLNSVSLFSPEDFKLLAEDIAREEKTERRGQEAWVPMTEQELFQPTGMAASAPQSRIGGGLQPAPAGGFSMGAERGTEGGVYHQNALPLQPGEGDALTDIPADIPKEERISLFYLLQHYNGERAKQYRAQQKQLKERKQALKLAKGAQGGKKEPVKKGKAKKEKSTWKTAADPGFQMPGAGQGERTTAPSGFQIPGKKEPVGAAFGAMPAAQRGMQTANNPGVMRPGNRPGAAQVMTGGAGNGIPKPPVSSGSNARNVNYGAAQGGQLNFGETTVLGGGHFGETTVLSGMSAPNAAKLPYLIRQKNHERIPINQEVFRLGKERSFVDYLISDNGAVSRSHANIVTRNGGYYVADNNSTNHTFLDGQMIESNVEYALRDGSKIRLANEEFEFRLI
ncbi:hypothetical protein B6K86_07740 [Lachnospiraceae bacterium]|nr:hypothetical protein B6K86_07740 [Lachnospiraceae bacterium]